MKPLIIKAVRAREILDSRSIPTVEAEIELMNGVIARASVPSGASTGEYEAWELRDEDSSRFGGKGVLKAVKNINTIINDALVDKNAADNFEIDKILIRLDGTENKSNLGANALLAVSMAAYRVASKGLDVGLYKYIGEGFSGKMPVPFMNILNGGMHAGNILDTQEFMIIPVGAPTFHEALRWGSETYSCLKKLLGEKGYSTAVGDEGGFAPNIQSDDEAVRLIIEAIQMAGYKPGYDISLGIDAAASEWKSGKKGLYRLIKSGKEISGEQLIEYWVKLCEKFPIISIEDPLDEDDWEGWKKITKILGSKIQIVGDDLFVTNIKRLQKGIDQNCGNSILIKPNQIGSVIETIEAINMAKSAGYKTIISHRSGDTEDTFIADLAVGMEAGQIKSGAPARTERVAKYNRLLRIEEEIEKNMH